MAKLLRSNGTVLGPQITLFPGNHLSFKVSGLGHNRKHLVLRSTDAKVKVVPVKVNDRYVEQNLRLEIQEHSIVSRQVVHVEAYVSGTSGRPEAKDANTLRLIVEILPRLELPAADTEAGILARMLITENAGPEHDLFVSLDDARECMQWMIHVMSNRLKLGPHHFSARGATNLTNLIKAPNQVRGFEGYPRIAAEQDKVLRNTLANANDGSHKLNKAYRTYAEHAIRLATERKIGSDPCATGLYAWRTDGSDSPGHNFVKFRKKGGQDFYTLTTAFLDSLKPKTVLAR